MLIARCYKTRDKDGNVVWKVYMTMDGRKLYPDLF